MFIHYFTREIYILSHMKIQKCKTCKMCHWISLSDHNFMDNVQIHTKLYIFGELSIWNCRIRCLKCVLEFYKKVKKKYVKILSSENGVFFKQKCQHFQCFDMFPVSDFHKNLRRSRQMSNTLKSAVFFKKGFSFKRYCDFRRFSLDGTFFLGITTKLLLSLEIKR